MSNLDDEVGDGSDQRVFSVEVMHRYSNGTASGFIRCGFCGTNEDVVWSNQVPLERAVIQAHFGHCPLRGDVRSLLLDVFEGGRHSESVLVTVA